MKYIRQTRTKRILVEGEIAEATDVTIIVCPKCHRAYTVGELLIKAWQCEDDPPVEFETVCPKCCSEVRDFDIPTIGDLSTIDADLANNFVRDAYKLYTYSEA